MRVSANGSGSARLGSSRGGSSALQKVSFSNRRSRTYLVVSAASAPNWDSLLLAVDDLPKDLLPCALSRSEVRDQFLVHDSAPALGLGKVALVRHGVVIFRVVGEEAALCGFGRALVDVG